MTCTTPSFLSTGYIFPASANNVRINNPQQQKYVMHSSQEVFWDNRLANGHASLPDVRGKIKRLMVLAASVFCNLCGVSPVRGFLLGFCLGCVALRSECLRSVFLCLLSPSIGSFPTCKQQHRRALSYGEIHMISVAKT